MEKGAHFESSYGTFPNMTQWWLRMSHIGSVPHDINWKTKKKKECTMGLRLVPENYIEFIKRSFTKPCQDGHLDRRILICISRTLGKVCERIGANIMPAQYVWHDNP